MYRYVTIRALMVVFAAGILLPVAVSAQSSMKSAPPSVPKDIAASATSPKVQASDWIAAAKVLEQAARLRAPGDARAVNDLLGAATAYETAGKLVLARKTVVEGARRAAQAGDEFTAANAYVAAARLCIQLRDENGAFTYLEHARRLATSPGMTPEQIRVIFTQIGKI